MTTAPAAFFLSFVALAVGCDGSRTEQPPLRARGDAGGPPAPRQKAASPPAEHPSAGDVPLVRRSRELMGTVFEIVFAEPESPRLDAAAGRALDEVARLEQVLSEWRPDTEVSAVNRAAGREAVPVSGDTLAVVRESLWIGRESEGAFDISWAALHGVWDFRATPPRVPPRAVLAAKTKLIDYRDVMIDETARTVKLAKPGMAIGLGGIAKGYALDRAAAILTAAGFHDFVIYGGGQVIVFGRRGDRPWRVGIRNPRGSDYFASFDATSGSAATAGDYERSFFLDGVRYHHIIDTRTGMPARGVASVTVLAPTGLRADAVDTAIFILGVRRGLALARRLGVEAVVVDTLMQVHATEGIRGRMRANPLPPPTP